MDSHRPDDMEFRFVQASDETIWALVVVALSIEYELLLFLSRSLSRSKSPDPHAEAWI